jgi:hypothetical protein
MPTLSRARAAFAVSLLTLVVSALSIAHNRQLGAMGGMTDEWYLLGANLSVSGTLGIGGEPIVTRPPGYPMFIAVSLRVLAGAPGQPTFEAYLQRGAHAVYLSQALLLAASAALLTWWAAEWAGLVLATFVGLLFGVNPYTVALVGLLHYDVLHIFLLLASGLATDRALRVGTAGDGAVGARARRAWAMAGVGLLWGFTTLVRPLTLVLPPLLFLAFWWHPRSGRRRALADAALVVLGMALVIAPYTWRNHRVSGQWVPVNAQGWVALWASTVKPLGYDPNHYYWDDLLPEFLRVFSQVTGQEQYSYATYNRQQGPLQAGFRAEALQNLRRQPAVYARNVVRSTVLLTAALNPILIDVYREFQRPAPPREKGWYFGANPRPYRPSAVARATAWVYAALTVLALLGAALGVTRRESALLVPAAVWLCLFGGHAMTYVDVMYLYLRLPFVFLFAAYGLSRLTRTLRVGGRPVRAGVLVSAALAVLAAGLTAVTILIV